MKKNAFDLLRILSAVEVMLVHFFAYFYQNDHATRYVYQEIFKAFFPVAILFSLSGFLIAASYENSASTREFFQKRILRLYPPLWLCTIVNLIVLSCLGQDIWNKNILFWVCTQIVGIAHTPSTLKHFATGSINGTLWTIFTEIQLYVVLGFTYRRLKKLSTLGWGILGIFFVGCNLGTYFLQDAGHGIPKILERLFLPYALWFFIGVYLYIYREIWIPRLKKYTWPLVILFAIYKCIPIHVIGHATDIVTSICMPFITIGLAFKLGNIRIKPDLSYGLFLYHWIVLNILVHYRCFETWNVAQSLLVFFGASIGFALFSYYFCNYMTGLWQRHARRSASQK